MSGRTDPEVLAALDEAVDLPEGRWRRDHALGPLTTYKVGGAAERFVEVADVGELRRVAAAVASLRSRAAAPEVRVVGRGSNLLVADDGVPGLVVQLGDGFARVEVELDDRGTGSGTVLVAGGAASLPVTARRSVASGLTGFEWAVGVPGSIGGAVRMNAGGHGSDMAATLLGVRVVDLVTGEDVEVEAGSLELGYRRSSLAAHQVVVHARLGLAPGDRAQGERELASIVRWRREHQPGGQNAGSVFTNPADDSAGRLVDLAGCRGLRVGTAQVSDKHANFIQADPGGSADDVLALMGEVVRRVHAHHGVVLHPETVLWGWDDPFAGWPR